MGIISWLMQRRARADAEASAELGRLRSMSDPRKGVHVVHVRSVYQRARSGTKATIVIDGFPGTRDAWFWDSRTIINGQVMAVSLGVGYGRHTNRNDVVYIGNRGANGIHGTLPGRAVGAAKRHDRRVARSRRNGAQPRE